MSWDAYLTTPSGETLHEQNYTHNVNPMIAAALLAYSGVEVTDAPGPLGKVVGPAWYSGLDGLTGATGSWYLKQIIDGLEADPDRYRAMNPENKWGSYDTLLPVLRKMYEAGLTETPCRWTVTG